MHDHGRSPTDDEAATWPRNQLIAGLQRRFLISPAVALESNEGVQTSEQMHRPWSHCPHSANGWSFGDHGAQLCCSPVRTGRKFARSVAQKRAVTALPNTRAPWLNTVNAPCSTLLAPSPVPGHSNCDELRICCSAGTIASFGTSIFVWRAPQQDCDGQQPDCRASARPPTSWALPCRRSGRRTSAIEGVERQS
jgi:hypothetical protein